MRIYQWNRNLQLDEQWILQRVSDAIDLRDMQVECSSDRAAVRLINSEGDGLSGLIVDKFGNYIVVQYTALALRSWSDAITSSLAKRFPGASICQRMDEKTASNEGCDPFDDWVVGEAPASNISIEENGVVLSLELANSQKTGYYLDQRTNRIRAAQWMNAGSLLDICCYNGGFSLAAAKHSKIDSIRAIDSSAVALERATRNAAANDISNIEFIKADCFDYLESLTQSGELVDNIVLDPPRMAGNRHQVTSALRAYHRLNLSAVKLLKSGGILVTCSCSGRVGRGEFAGMLASVAQRVRRSIQFVEMRGADFDHPVNSNCPEGEYLKCFICRVE
ncbi:MAG TPA: class I SAM-dependent rRNA methyltransferase [Planctomycetaceae bacterium]|nr:class I SAM-dependent rRNA methyltransferase [Planctomycetaceae bacterium]